MWTKREDDKVETSRMGNDDDKVVEVDNGNEVDTIEVQMNPSGHKPRVIYGHCMLQQDHTGTWKRGVT